MANSGGEDFNYGEVKVFKEPPEDDLMPETVDLEALLESREARSRTSPADNNRDTSVSEV